MSVEKIKEKFYKVYSDSYEIIGGGNEKNVEYSVFYNPMTEYNRFAAMKEDDLIVGTSLSDLMFRYRNWNVKGEKKMETEENKMSCDECSATNPHIHVGAGKKEDKQAQALLSPVIPQDQDINEFIKNYKFGDRDIDEMSSFNFVIRTAYYKREINREQYLKLENIIYYLQDMVAKKNPRLTDSCKNLLKQVIAEVF